MITGTFIHKITKCVFHDITDDIYSILALIMVNIMHAILYKTCVVLEEVDFVTDKNGKKCWFSIIQHKIIMVKVDIFPKQTRNDDNT